MTIQQTLYTAVNKLRKKGINSAHLDAEVLLAFVMKKPKTYLLAHPDKKMTTGQRRRFAALIRKRLNGMPIAYMTGTKEFYGLEFHVDKHVLIPRPDTEILIEQAIKAARDMTKKHADAHTFVLTDIGTGSGCIAVTLAKYLPGYKIIATDISAPALKVARQNARTHKVASRITFKQGDLLKPLQRNKTNPFIHILTANLPYLTRDELENVPHEPAKALDGGKMGLQLIERLLATLPQVLMPQGMALLEIAPTQTDAVRYLTEQHLPERSVFFIKDLGRRDRIAKII